MPAILFHVQNIVRRIRRPRERAERDERQKRRHHARRLQRLPGKDHSRQNEPVFGPLLRPSEPQVSRRETYCSICLHEGGLYHISNQLSARSLRVALQIPLGSVFVLTIIIVSPL